MSNHTYECRSSDDPPELARPVVASSPREAAERFAAQRDRDSVEYPAESEVVVATANGAEVTFVVTLRAEPWYSAKLKRTGEAA